MFENVWFEMLWNVFGLPVAKLLVLIAVVVVVLDGFRRFALWLKG